MRSREISKARDAIDHSLGSMRSLAKSVGKPAHVVIDGSRKCVIVSNQPQRRDRGVYFNDPAGQHLEIITRPYGGG